MADQSKATPSVTPSWAAGLPEPLSAPESITAETLAELIKTSSKTSGKDYIVVDVRRTDFENYAIPVAAYYQDVLNEKGIATSEALYLEGGIKGWIEKYKDDESLVTKL
ncbi:hypothetical protein ACEPAI_419 [Sanghuangporus weigelae]